MIKKITIENTEEVQTTEEKLEIFRKKINEIIDSANAEKAKLEVSDD